MIMHQCSIYDFISDTKNITEIPVGDVGSLKVLDVFEDSIVCARTCLRYPSEIKLTKYFGEGKLSDFTVVKSTTLNPDLDHFAIDYLSLQSEEKGDTWSKYFFEKIVLFCY